MYYNGVGYGCAQPCVPVVQLQDMEEDVVEVAVSVDVAVLSF